MRIIVQKIRLFISIIIMILVFITFLNDFRAVAQSDSKIVFESARNGTPLEPDSLEIIVMSPDGSDQTLLTQNLFYDGGPSWSPAGDRIAFSSNRDGNNEIYIMNDDGTNPFRLTNNPASDREPAWFPDGSKLAFTSGRDGNPEIYIMDSAGTNIIRLTFDEAVDTSPDWSPDGSKIVFTSTRDGNPEIYVMNADGSNQTRLTNESAVDNSPAWSPDGTQIAFVSTRDGYSNIYTMNADSSNLTQITSEVGEGASEPTWSPDAAQIAYVAHCVYPGYFNIITISLDGSNRMCLNEDIGFSFNGSPDWGEVAANSTHLTITIPPTDGMTLTTQDDTRFQAVAYDPAVGTNAGDGIQQVDFNVYDPSGKLIYADNELRAAFCTFGGDGPCNAAPAGLLDLPGTYTLKARAETTPGTWTEWVSRTFVVDNPDG